jgi:hypothetical protein
VEETDPNTILDMAGNFNHSVLRLGLLNDPLNVSIEPLQGIQTVGNSIDYTLGLNQGQNGLISYVLNPTILLGEEIKYVLTSNFGIYTKRDTITKTYGNPTLQYQNDASAIVDWTGTWNVTSESFVSPTTSFTDSPLTTYNNNSTKQFQFNNYINLTNANLAKIEFQAKWSIETDFDYAQFLVSIDAGVTWIPQCGKYTNAGISGNGGVQPLDKPIYDGAQDTWVLEEISLNDYLGDSILVKFVLQSDFGVKEDGFYFDDFKVMFNENPIIIDSTNIGLAEINSTKLLVFPNPAKDKIKISSSTNLKNGNLKITDSNGKIVFEEKIMINQNEKEISTFNFGNGYYLVEFISDKNHISRNKLMIVK